jgi:hypothetical protein
VSELQGLSLGGCMNKRILDALDNVLIGVLLFSSYFGFFFIVSACLILAGMQFTTLIAILVFLCSCGFTHLLLRWIYRVQQKSLYFGWKEKNQKKAQVEDE